MKKYFVIIFILMFVFILDTKAIRVGRSLVTCGNSDIFNTIEPGDVIDFKKDAFYFFKANGDENECLNVKAVLSDGLSFSATEKVLEKDYGQICDSDITDEDNHRIEAGIDYLYPDRDAIGIQEMKIYVNNKYISSYRVLISDSNGEDSLKITFDSNKKNALPGEKIEYTVSIKNEGNKTYNNLKTTDNIIHVALNDVLEEIEYSLDSSTGIGNSDADSGNSRFICWYFENADEHNIYLGDVYPNEILTLKINAKVNESSIIGTNIVNTLIYKGPGVKTVSSIVNVSNNEIGEVINEKTVKVDETTTTTETRTKQDEEKNPSTGISLPVLGLGAMLLVAGGSIYYTNRKKVFNRF